MNQKLIVFIVLCLSALACNAGSGGRPDSSATVNAILDTPAPAGISAAGDVKDPDNLQAEAEAPTRTPTATATLTPTATPPERRSGLGEDILVPVCDDEIEFAVDAQDNDWQQQDSPQIEVDSITFGIGRWSGEEDLSGTMQMCWSEEVLRLYVDIIDDAHVQTQEGRDQWQGDEIEIVFDGELRDDFFEEDTSEDDVQLGISPGDLAGSPISVVRFVPRPFEELDTVSAQARRALEAGGNYTFEFSIPWSELQVDPEPEAVYGFCLALSDNDQVGQASQDSLVSHCPRLVTNDPTTWASMELE